MSGRGRRVALILGVLALALSLGHWGAVFLTERLWEATVSEAVAIVSTRRALLELGLELTGILIAVAWLAAHLLHAARVALPDRAPPERENAQLWPAALPRWTLAAAAILLGLFLGSGAGQWLDELLLTLDGVKLGVLDPLLNTDLGGYLREVPLWIDAQRWSLGLALTTALAVLLLHFSGGTFGFEERRLGVSPRARGQIAVVLAVLAATLAWGALLEPYRLAAGDRGPLQGSEFVLRMLIAEVSAGLLAAAAAVTLLWWLRLRGLVVVVAWALAGLGLATMAFLPVRHDGTVQDAEWRSGARLLDSVAFALGGLEGGSVPAGDSIAGLSPTLWDESLLERSLGEGGEAPRLSQGVIQVGGHPVPVWLGVRTSAASPPSLLAVGDAAVSGAGGPLFWREGDSTSQPGLRAYRALPPHSLRPGGPAVEAATGGPGIELSSWPRRLMLGWALQSPLALRRSAGDHLLLRLDPQERLSRLLPSVHWTNPRLIVLGSSVVWISDGLISASRFPSSHRVVQWGRALAMLRPMLVAIVDGASGVVNVFRQSDSDSVSGAFARISRPLIRPAAELPAGLRVAGGYPDELLSAQAEVLTGGAWAVGKIDGATGEDRISRGAGAGTSTIVFKPQASGSTIVAALLARRTPQGDSLHLIRFDSLHAAPGRELATERWDRLPFQFSVRDSVRAVRDSFEVGQVRYQYSREGMVTYQPAWSVDSTGRARLVVLNVAIGDRKGTGRTWTDAWRNFRNEVSPLAAGAGASAVLEQARLWMRRADSALKRGDLPEFDKALANLREILGATGRKP